MTRPSKLVVALVAVAALAGCGNDEPTAEVASVTTTLADEPAETTTTTAADEPADDEPAQATEESASPGDRGCDDFASQEEAQAYFESQGGSPDNNVDGLDTDGDGIACELLGSAVADEQPASEPEPAPEAPAEDPEVAAARGKAADYLDFKGFCRPSLIDQLEHEGYSNSASTAAVDSLGVDWYAETVRVAQAYVDFTEFSHSGLVGQLEHEGCEPDHAERAATQVLGF